jgi:hypothetical protein
MGWIAVDLDGTLSRWVGNGEIIGPPIPRMVARVRHWLSQGKDVRIFTSRISHKDPEKREAVTRAIETWCESHIGQKIPVTNVKDFHIDAIWDDKAIRVMKNTGLSYEEYARLKR